MPLPKPKKRAKKQNFISRCMGNKTMKNEFKKNKQRLAVCYKRWRKK